MDIYDLRKYLMAELPAQIEELEAQVERLSDAAANCRKIAVAAQISAAGGGLILISMILGILGFSPESLIVSIAALLGGIALRGTNRSTLEEIRGKIIETERRRSTLIDALQLRAVATPWRSQSEYERHLSSTR